MPRSAPLTCSTALRTPLPPKPVARPAATSTAPRTPGDAPEGTAARPATPESSVTSASTVGLPRESMISRPRTSAMRLMAGTASYQGFLEGLFLDGEIEFHERGEERGHALQRPGVGTVRLR